MPSTSADAPVYVCPVEGLAEAVADTGARDLITLINAQTMAELATPPGIAPGRHLRLVMNDIVEPQEDMILPCAAHVDSLIAFAKGWTRQAPLLINCRAGRSRSAAAAFIVLCALNPGVAEAEIATLLRAASLTARPNHLLIRLADEALGRRGRMIAAIEAIDPADPAPGKLFSLPSRL